MFHYSKSKNVDFLKLHKTLDRAYGKIPFVKKRRKKQAVFNIFRYLSLFVLFCFVLLILFLAYNFLSLKNVYHQAFAGKNNLEYALDFFKEKGYESSADASGAAKDNFSAAFTGYEKIHNGFFIQNIGIIRQQSDDIYYLLSSGKNVSSAINLASALGLVFSDYANEEINFTLLNAEQKIQILRKLHESEAIIDNINSDLQKAFSDMEKISDRGLLRPLKFKLHQARKQLEEARDFAGDAAPLLKLIPEFFGYPEKSAFLVLMQNSDELRPTGGFIGTYGILELENGEILRSDTHDVYHLDMPVKDLLTVEPPLPLQKYLGVPKWYMRDANWSPDWRESAKKIEWFFHEEDKLLPPKNQINNFQGNFKGIIGITPDVIIDFLSLSGPIVIEGVEYNSSNFVDLLQYRVERGYVELGVSSWQRKEVIGEITKELKNRILSLPPGDLYAAGNILFDNLLKKNILINLKDEQGQKVIEGRNWGGAVNSDFEDDFVMVVDANMAAYKTDGVMNRKIEYKIDEGVNGVFADLTIDYKHNGEGFDWKITRYRTYTRVYVPAGSELVASEGFTEGEAEVYSEFNKTVFAGFLSIEPGQFARLKFRYKLNDEIAKKMKSGEYRLLFQKQPGNKIEDLILNLGFNREITAYAPAGFYAENYGKRIKWESDLENDRLFSVDLRGN